MNRAGNVRAGMARDAAWSRELAEQPPHPGNVLRDLRIKFRVGAFEVNLGNDRRPAVPRSRDIDDTGIVTFDEPVQMGIDKILPGRRSPMAKQSRLDVLRAQRFAEQRIVLQIDLSNRQVVGRAPIGVEEAEVVVRRAVWHPKYSWAVGVVVRLRIR